MTAFAMTSVHIALNQILMAGWANQVELSAESDEIDVTTLDSGGYRRKITGLGMFAANVSGFQSYAGTGPAELGGPAALGNLDTFTLSAPGTTEGNVAYFGQCRELSITDLSGSVGDAATFAIQANGTGRLVRGFMLQPDITALSTTNSTVQAFTPPTSTQSLYAAFHVHGVTGSGTVTFTVRTDDAVGFSTPTTRITSTAFTSAGHQFTSAAGALTGETHIRLTTTISGFTAVRFSVAVGVGPT